MQGNYLVGPFDAGLGRGARCQAKRTGGIGDAERLFRRRFEEDSAERVARRREAGHTRHRGVGMGGRRLSPPCGNAEQQHGKFLRRVVSTGEHSLCY